MNKRQLCDELARRLGKRPKDMVPIVDHFLRTMARELANGGYVEFRGFGRFQLRKHKGHTMQAINGARVRVKERLIPYFHAHRDLRTLIERKHQHARHD